MVQINRQRNGEKIDEEVMENAVNIYVEMDEGSKKYYEEDFELPMLVDTVRFYSTKASEWASLFDSSHDMYLKKVIFLFFFFFFFVN